MTPEDIKVGVAYSGSEYPGVIYMGVGRKDTPGLILLYDEDGKVLIGSSVTKTLQHSPKFWETLHEMPDVEITIGIKE